MSVVDMTKHTPEPEPERHPRTALDRVRAGAAPRTPVDTTKPMRPEWAQTWAATRHTVGLALRRARYRIGLELVHLPGLLVLLALWCPRGLGRVIAALSKWIYDQDSAEMRAQHAGNRESAEYTKLHNIRKANLHARLLVFGVIALVTVGPVMAWVFPHLSGWLVGAFVGGWVIKLIPGRSLTEVLVGAAVAVAVGLWLPTLLVQLPPVPLWAIVAGAVAVVLALGVVGRPSDRKLSAAGNHGINPELQKPTADMVVDALVAAVPGITEKNRDTVRIHNPGVARGKQGYYLSLELVPGVTVSDVMEEREAFAAACRRKLGSVWPGHGGMHPGHLRLFLGDVPMAEAEQPAWPLAADKRVDIFDPLRLFTDQECEWRDQRLMYNALVVGGAPGFGKTFFLRAVGVAIARDPRTKMTILDGKANGDMRPFRLVAHGYHEGDEPEDIAAQLKAVQALRQEMRRRAKFLRELPADLNPEDKVTTKLVDLFPHLAPWFLLIDECQVYTQHPDQKIRDAFIEALADIVRRGRSAGIVPVFCTQKPDAKVLPTAIVDNCSVRVCFKVNGQRANDAVLGNEMHSSGIKATKFGPDDKGLAWVKGDGATPFVARSPYGVDKPTAEQYVKQCRAQRERLGLLTGYAAGEETDTEQVLDVDLLADVADVLDSPENGGRAMSLAGLLERLELLRPTVWGHLDVDALGAALRNAGVTPASVYCADLKRSGQGVKREWIDDARGEDNLSAGG